MKKQLIALTSLVALSFGASAQLRVLSNGHIQLGDWTNGSQTSQSSSGIQNESAEKAAVITLPKITPDTTTTISVLGPTKLNYSGGSLSFGGRKDVMIQEESFTSNLSTTYGRMSIVGKGGLKYTSSNGVVFSYDPGYYVGTTGKPAFCYNVNVQAPTYLTSSDARYKKNVESLESMGEMLGELTPVSYHLDLGLGGEPAEAQKASALNDRRSFGFIAQEVREIFPELVYEDADGMLSVDYNGFIPLLVDAYKALNVKIAKQEKLISTLTDGARKTKGAATVSDIDVEDAIVLMQNRPNPFKDETEIRCHLPENISDAFICIYDLNGRQQIRLSILDRGDVSVMISGNALPAGIYIYTLIADGQEVDTKRMILTE